MDNSDKRYVPGLGTVILGTSSYGVMQAAHQSSTQAEESGRSAVFANFVLSCMLEEPAQTPEQISDLPGSVITVLVDIAVDELELREEFDSLPATLSPQERLYQAWIESVKRLGAAIRQQVARYEETTSIFCEHIKRLQEAMQRAHASFYEQIARQQEVVQRAIASFGETITQSLEEAKVVSKIVGTPLTRAGFWIPPSAPVGLLRLLRALINEERDTPESMRQAIVDYYESGDSCQLRNMVDDWQRNPYFADRMQIINDALEAHIEGKYTLSIPALLPLVEGILTDIVGRRTRADGCIRGWAGKALERMCDDFLREACKDAVIEYVTGIAFYGYVEPDYFTPQKFPEWLELKGLTGSQVLQRHAILHGVQVDYASKENSLRAFFLLDVLSGINRQEWDQRLRAAAHPPLHSG